MPKISVVLPVHNGGGYVAKAVESILAQSYGDFEIIAINDGSTDNSAQILEEFSARDTRLKVFSQEKRGLTATLNRACELASGEFIARQDADDISAGDRFKKQVEYLESHPSVVMCGTWSFVVHPEAGVLGSWQFPDDSALLYELLAHQLNPFIHASVMFRRETFARVAGGYRFGDVAQDLDLWIRMGEIGALGMVESNLFAYFLSPGSITEAQNACIKEETAMIRRLQNERAEAGREIGASGSVAAHLPVRKLTSGELGWYGAAVYRLLAGDLAGFRSHLAMVRELGGMLAGKARLLTAFSWLPGILGLFYRVKMGRRIRYIRFYKRDEIALPESFTGLP